MENIFKILINILTLIIVTSSCSTKWTKAISYGSVKHYKAQENIDIEINKKLIIVPITLEGKKYRFLFDSGAPLSISKELQAEYNFKIISKGKIVDSDHNRKKVNWSKIDSISIGNVIFKNQTAFVGNFKANPILKCLKIDGIIGSNLIRQCNWTINQSQNILTITNINEVNLKQKEGVTIPFKTDYQYNLFIDVNFGQSKLNNVLVDYGSNGSIAMSNEIFNALKNKNVFGNILLEKGVTQSGIIGIPIPINRKISFSDSVQIENLHLKNIRVQTGKTTSIGNDVLSMLDITIDWQNKKLHLIKSKKDSPQPSFKGFKLGYSSDIGIYVQSVIENSNAYKKGIRSNMRLSKVDQLDFINGNDFCDYVNHEYKDQIFLEVVNSEKKKVEYNFKNTDY
ncbi:MAG: aspartyl protease family protein [Vicingaceae bacterium]|nr:aspartyl protease family protein [Vicingaceae bacterium]